jgi:hypothetical protein
MKKLATLISLVLLGTLAAATAAEEPGAWKAFADGRFAWKATGPLVSADSEAAEPETALKDPSIVRYRDRWHLFCTVRLASGKIDVEYANFADWNDERENIMAGSGRHRGVHSALCNDAFGA